MNARFDFPRLQSALLSLAVIVSIAGFIGIQRRSGFMTVPPPVVLSLQIVLLAAGLCVGLRRCLARLPSLWPYVLMALLAFASVMWSADGASSFKRALLVFVPGLSLSLLAAGVKNPMRSLALTTMFLGLLVILSLLWSEVVLVHGRPVVLANGSGSWLIGDFGIRYGQRRVMALNLLMVRPAGLTSNPNTLAILSALTSFLILAHKPWLKCISWFMVVLLAVMGGAIFWTFSRGAFLFMLSATGVFAGIVLKRPLLTKWTLVSTFLIPIVLGILVFGQGAGIIDFPWLGKGAFSIQYGAFSLSERTLIWRAVLSAFRQWGFFGIGFGRVQEALVEPAGFISAAHSVPFTILGELGVVGFVTMFMLWAVPLRNLYHRSADNIYVVAGLAAVLVGLFAHQSFDSSIFRYHPVHFIFSYVLGLAMNPALYRSESNIQSGREEILADRGTS